MAEKS